MSDRHNLAVPGDTRDPKCVMGLSSRDSSHMGAMPIGVRWIIGLIDGIIWRHDLVFEVRVIHVDAGVDDRDDNRTVSLGDILRLRGVNIDVRSLMQVPLA